MDQVIFLKYGELCLKGKNRNFFTTQAIKNLQYALKPFEVKIDGHFDYVIISNFKVEQLDEIKNILKVIPGFSYFCNAFIVEKDIDIISKSLISLLPTQPFTFKVESKRSDKSFKYNSDEIKRMVGNNILNGMQNATVDVHKPQLKINIEIKNEYAIFYINKFKSANGLPIETSGRVLMLLSGGIDSPVASYQLMKRGFHVDFITFITPPHTSDMVLNKIEQLAKQVTMNGLLQENTKIYVCNFSPVQQELMHIEKESYRITLLRRSFLRIASRVRFQYEYDALATGEALGQVASQTIQSMKCIDSSVDDLILRPLLCFDKETIITMAKELKTYEISILPYDDACSLFAPKNPITTPNVASCQNLEAKLELLQNIEQVVFSKLSIIKI